jgi:uncharacterized membrane protein YkvA (DUF1232 family)
METWQIILLAIVIVLALLMAAGWLVWRRASRASKELLARVGRLPLRYKLRFAGLLVVDERIPLGARALLPLLVLYLSLPIDLVPDFIPVLGQLDDLVITLLGISLLLRFAPRGLLEEVIGDLEREAAADRRSAG